MVELALELERFRSKMVIWLGMVFSMVLQQLVFSVVFLLVFALLV